MADLVTLATLRADCRQEADMEGSGFIQDPELDKRINRANARLYDMLVAAYDSAYFHQEYLFSTNATDKDYPLPAGFYKMVGLDRIISSDQSVTLKPYMFAKRNAYTGPDAYWGQLGELPAYHLVKDNLRLEPKPNAIYNMRLWYIPVCPKLTAPTDSFDYINGYQDYVICEVAMGMLRKEESDTRDLQARKMEITKLLSDMAGNRDAGMPQRVSDVRRTSQYNDYRGEIY